jgi:magnesium-transporting ATPase (P-type)
MEDPPRNPKNKILNYSTIKGILFSGIIMGLVAYGTFFISLFIHPGSGQNYEKAITVTFVSIIICISIYEIRKKIIRRRSKPDVPIN